MYVYTTHIATLRRTSNVCEYDETITRIHSLFLLSALDGEVFIRLFTFAESVSDFISIRYNQ